MIMFLHIVNSIYVERDDYYQATSKDTKDTYQNDESEEEPKTNPKIIEMQKLYKYRAMSVFERMFEKNNNNNGFSSLFFHQILI